MKKCECYHEVTRMLYSSILEQLYPTAIDGECWGTKERDICNCQGDKCKCDFYPEVRITAREETRREQKDNKLKCIKESLKFYLDTHEENGVVYIPKFMIEKMIEELENNG